MRVGIQTWGTEGDIRPFFGLAQALSARGHEVRVNYTSVEGRAFERLAEACGVRARDVGGDYFRQHREVVAGELAAIFTKTSPLRQIRGILETSMDPVIDVMFDAALDLAAESDVVVGHFITHPAGAAAQKHRRPYALVSLAPVLPSAHYAPIGAPNLGRYVNPLVWRVFGRILESLLRDRVNHIRARAGLPLARNLMATTLDHAALVLTAVSPTLFPRPIDWDPRIALSGFLGIREASEPWEPDAALRAFLDAGAPPVFLSFGSMFTLGDARTLEAIAIMKDAVDLAGTRGIIQAPAHILARCEPQASIHFLERAPHARLFPQCAAIVHHGGAGTTQSALLAGRPSIVVAHVADQFFWGERLRALGLGAKPLTRVSLNAKALAGRIRDALGDPGFLTRTGQASASLRLEDGPTSAAALIERLGEA